MTKVIEVILTPAFWSCFDLQQKHAYDIRVATFVSLYKHSKVYLSGIMKSPENDNIISAQILNFPYQGIKYRS